AWRRLVHGLMFRAARLAGLGNAGVHRFRHWFCSHLSMRGASVRAIQQHAGVIKAWYITPRYMYLNPSAVEAVVLTTTFKAFFMANDASGNQDDANDPVASDGGPTLVPRILTGLQRGRC